MSMKCIVLMSGGMDSTVLFYKIYKEGKSIIPVFIDYGQHTAEKEFKTLKEILPKEYVRKIKKINLSGIYEESSSVLFKEHNLWVDKVTEEDMYIPYRNLVIFSVAVAYAQTIEVKEVYAAFINTYYAKEIDASINFLNKIENLMKNISNVKVKLPFKKMSKKDVLSLGLKLKAPVMHTYSCQINSVNPCGSCPNCVERLAAIEEINEK